jgi:hypothetical protein
VQIVSVMAPYLRGRSRQLFDDLVSGKLPKREFYDYLPPRDATPSASAAAPVAASANGAANAAAAAGTEVARERSTVKP